MQAVYVKDLSLAYPGKEKTLDNISFSVETGELIVIGGLSGCGKTSLAKLLTGIIPEIQEATCSGIIYLNGMDIAEKRPSSLAGIIGILFQNSADQMVCTTVEDEIAFGPENFLLEPEKIKKAIDAMCEKFSLKDLRLRNPGTLSGGQQKLAAIAAISVLEPSIFILDEPITGLDAYGKDIVYQLLLQLKKAGHTVLMIEHELNAPTAGLADRWLLLRDGKIAGYDTPENLKCSGLPYEMELLYDD